MSEASYESVISEINSLLSSMDADERVKMIEELKKIPAATKTKEEMEELVEYLRSLAI